jgi:hypothetical protein
VEFLAMPLDEVEQHLEWTDKMLAVAEQQRH